MAALRRAARAVLRCEHAAEDVAQDAWVAAMGPPEAGGEAKAPAGNPFAWLGGVARQLVRREQRARAQRRSAHALRAREESELLHSGGERSDPTVEAAAVSEAASALAAAVHALPDHYRAVVVMRFWKGDSVGQIASQLDLPPRTVSNRLHRALTELRRTFSAGGDGGPSTALGLSALATLALPKSGLVAPALLPALLPTLLAMKTLSAVLIGIVAAALLFLRDAGGPEGAVPALTPEAVESAGVSASAEPLGGSAEGVAEDADEASGQRHAIASAEPAAPAPPKPRWSVSVEVEPDPSGERIASRRIQALDPGTSIRVLPEEVAPGEIAEKEFTAASVVKSGGAWTISPNDPHQASIVVACMVADRVLECRRVDPTTETVVFRVNALRARSLCCGSIRFRVTDGQEADAKEAARFGLSAGKGVPANMRTMLDKAAPGEWQLIEGLPACALTLTVFLDWATLGVRFDLEPGQLLDPTIFTSCRRQHPP